MNTFMNNLEAATNFTRTTNGALAHKTAGSKLYDMFALGGSYRQRTDDDVKFLFKQAYDENPEYALKCLFYLRNIRGTGQGERRFFRVAYKYLASYDTAAALRNMYHIAEFGRIDDLYCLDGTPLETQMYEYLAKLLNEAIAEIRSGNLTEKAYYIFKWVKSCNTSSAESRRLGNKTRESLGLTAKQYRKLLAYGRKETKVLERIISENRWEDVEFDKIPSQAGLKYRNAFLRHDVDRPENKVSYEAFMKDENTTVNAGALYPYDIVGKAIQASRYTNEVERKAVEKYWNNQKDYLNGKPCKMMCVCDTSGSMTWGSTPKPIDVAISLSMYCAERISGPFKDHYISFSSRPQMIHIDGIDFVDKVQRIYRTNLCDNTNLVATFELLRKVTLQSDPSDRLDTIVVISDMQIDEGASSGWGRVSDNELMTEMEQERRRWAADGLVMPRLVYWNVNASNNTILDKGPNVSLVSGCSPSIFNQVITGRNGYDLMMDVLNEEIFACIK